MGHQHVSIRHPSELAGLTAWRVIPPRAPAQVVLAAEGASAERVRSWERELTRLHAACGCEQGALGLIVGVLGCALFLLLRSGGWGHPGRAEFWRALGVVVITTSLGKLLGLLAARRRLKRIILEIQSQWVAGPVPEHTLRPGEMSRRGGPGSPTTCCGGEKRSSAAWSDRVRGV